MLNLKKGYNSRLASNVYTQYTHIYTQTIYDFNKQKPKSCIYIVCLKYNLIDFYYNKYIGKFGDNFKS